MKKSLDFEITETEKFLCDMRCVLRNIADNGPLTNLNGAIYIEPVAPHHDKFTYNMGIDLGYDIKFYMKCTNVEGITRSNMIHIVQTTKCLSTFSDDKAVGSTFDYGDTMPFISNGLKSEDLKGQCAITSCKL